MAKVKYLILGGGPAGLTMGAMLLERGETSFLVVEKEEEAGGLCRSVTVDGSPFDIGGGHFLDVRRPKVDEFLFRYLPREEWKEFERDSRIAMGDCYISHPLEANIWQLPLDEQVSYLASIARAGCNSGQPMPERFTEWITWKLGERIAQDYMLPYNQKMFAQELDELGTYWLEKLPDVSFEDTLRSCLLKKPYGKQPGHARFYYPKHYGYGEVWLKIAESLGSHIRCGEQVSKLDIQNKRVTLHSGEELEGERIITTIPWTCLKELKGLPSEMLEAVKSLRSSSIETRYVPGRLDTKAQWIYEPDPAKPYHRILVRHNFLEGSRGYWLETRAERTGLYSDQEQTFCYENEYAYPLNTIGKPEVMKKLLSFCEKEGVYGLGRWGEHSHYNSDLVVEKAMELADRL